MENGKACVYFFKQMNASGSEKSDGYDSKILDDVYDWEREEVEEIIWKEFQKGKDGDLTVFCQEMFAKGLL